MAHVNVPTGQKTVTVTMTGKSLLHYRCCTCGKPVLQAYDVRGTGMASFRADQSEEAKHTAREQAMQIALQNLEERDALLFEVFNSTHKYEKIKDPIQCPACHTVQPWSRLLEKDRKLSFLWMFAGIALLFALLFHVMDIWHYLPWEAWVGVGVALAALTVWVCMSANKERKQALAALQKGSFVPPAYYNRRNIEELAEHLPASSLPPDLLPLSEPTSSVIVFDTE